MDIQTDDLTGLEVRSRYIPKDWGASLAGAIHTAFGGAPGKHFVADLLKVDRVFPPDWHPLQRRERLNRMFQGGEVQVGALVFALESAPGRIYQKTKRIVAREDSLPDHGRTTQSGVGLNRAAPLRTNALLIPDAVDPPRDDLKRIVDDLQRVQAAILDRLEGIEKTLLMSGVEIDTTKIDIADEKVTRVMRRIALLDQNLRRLVEALRSGDIDRYSEKFPDPEFPAEPLP